MSLEDLGNVGEFVAAVVVVVSLIYLALQIRQNTRSVRMASHHGLMSEFRTNVRVLTQDPELGRLFQEGLERPQELSEVDRVRFASFQDPRRPSPNSSNPGRSRLARVRIVGHSPSAANIPWAS